MSRKKEYVLLVLLGVIVLAAGGYLFQVWEDYHEASAGYQKLQKYVIEKPDVEKEDGGQAENQNKPEENLPEIDFDGLRAINKDIVAWIRIPGIGVDYPVVQGKDTSITCIIPLTVKQIRRAVFFLDYRNRVDFADSKVILYGHNMKDGSMFSNLKKYQDEVFRREQGKVVLYLPDKVLECEIVECRQVSVQDSVYEVIQENETDVPKQMILSTCSAAVNNRMILECKVKFVAKTNHS